MVKFLLIWFGNGLNWGLDFGNKLEYNLFIKIQVWGFIIWKGYMYEYFIFVYINKGI